MITIYILCNTSKYNKKHQYYLISLCITSLRKMLLVKQIPEIDMFVPSYLYVHMIGFIHCPLIY